MSLAEIMKSLTPPQQDYERLAQELSRYRPVDTLERVVHAYFEVFANGYDFWQANYDYPRIFEYFYGAFLLADDLIPRKDTRSLGAILPGTLSSFFENLSLALLHNTRCENAMLCNVHHDLLTSAEKARDYAKEALRILNEEIWDDLPDKDIPVFESIRTYININLKLYHGYAKCAELYLLRWSAKKDGLKTVPDTTAAIKGWLDQLRPESRELFSELRTHFITASRLIHDFEERGATSLVIKQADLYLRATAYAGPRLTELIFNIFNDKSQGRPALLKRLEEITGLRASDVHTGGFLDDSLETVLATDIGNRIIFDFPAGDPETGISVHTFDGEKGIEQSADEITVGISKRGNVTVEIKFTLGDPGADISMSHLRFMNALLSPHIGTLDITWYGDPAAADSADSARTLRAEAINYVNDYLVCDDWYRRANKTFNAIPASERGTLTGIETALTRLRNGLFDLAGKLRNPAIENPTIDAASGDHEVTHVSTSDLENVLKVYEPLRTQFQNWNWLTSDFTGDMESEQYKAWKVGSKQSPFTGDTESEQYKTWTKGRELFPSSGARHYIRLIDICMELLGVEESSDEPEEADEATESTESAETSAAVGHTAAASSQPRKGFKGFLEQLAQEAAAKQAESSPEAKPRTYDDYDRWQYDPNLGWQSIVVVNRLAKRTLGSDGTVEMEPLSEAEQKEILTHPEFKGFVIGRQEVGGLDDWMYAVDPTTTTPPILRNLAYVRSHDKDVVYVGPNNVCLYMINNPQFLVDVTFLLTQLIGDVRAIVLAYHMNARQVVEELAELLEKQASKQEIIRFRQTTLRWRREVTLFFELIRDLPISRYQDHADLMREMLKESGINDWLNLLSQSVSTLDTLLSITEALE